MKFVVGSVEDLDCMRRMINQYPTKAQIYVSPSRGKIEAAFTIIDYMKEHNLQMYDSNYKFINSYGILMRKWCIV